MFVDKKKEEKTNLLSVTIMKPNKLRHTLFLKNLFSAKEMTLCCFANSFFFLEKASELKATHKCSSVITSNTTKPSLQL